METVSPKFEVPKEEKLKTLKEDFSEKSGELLFKRITKKDIFTAKWLQVIARVPVRLLFHFFVSFQVSGLENLSLSEEWKGKGLIFAPNHVSELDVIAVRAALPFFGREVPLFFVSRPPDYYHGLHAPWKYFYGGRIFRFCGAYPAFSGFKNYKKSLTYHIKLLQQGKSLLIFPEGTMSKTEELGEPRGGVGYLSHTLQIPIIPVRIEGLFHLDMKSFFLRRRKVRVFFGKPLFPEDLFARGEEGLERTGEEYKQASRRVLSQIIKK